MENKLKPAVIGGIFIGVLSVIPFVNWANICCCLWAILGGLLASSLYVKGSPVAASAGDGAIVGGIAGVVGALISLVVGIPVAILTSAFIGGILVNFVEGVDPSQAEAMRAQLLASQSIVGAIINGLIVAVGLVVFSILGGLVGIPIFEKRKREILMPPAPQNFG
jgi:hypothetical protein